MHFVKLAGCLLYPAFIFNFDRLFWTTFHIALALISGMLKNKWGRISNVSSPVVSGTSADRAPYTIGKSAQAELKYTGVTANIMRVKTNAVIHAREKVPSFENVFWTIPAEIWASIENLCCEEVAVNGARLLLYGSM